MTSNDREHDFNLDMNTQQHWRPIPGVGVITIEQFVNNHMVDSNKSVGHFHNEFPTNLFSYLMLYEILLF
jgi:hypothetical protein